MLAMQPVLQVGKTQYTPQAFVSESFNASWLKDLQEVVAFWLSAQNVLLVQTSGSTGVPKAIALSRSVLLHSAKSTLAFLGLDGGSALHFLPAKYIGGKMMLLRALVANMHIELVEPHAALPELTREYDLVALTPMQAAKSINQLQHFRHIILGGGAVSVQLIAALQQLPGKVYNSYGMTETASHVALKILNGPDKSDFFVAMDGVTFSCDNRGCLVIHAPAWQAPELVTNDVVKLISTTQFKWLGRFDNVINSGGVKISPEELEHKLARQLNVPFFIGALPDEILGEKVVLVIASKDEIALDFNVLPKLYRPKETYYLPEFIYTETHKINRKATLSLLLAG